MSVRTSTEEVEKHRRTLLEMVASENRQVDVDPLTSYASQRAGPFRRPLRRARRPLRGGTKSATSKEDDNPFLLRDYEQCILPPTALCPRLRRAGGGHTPSNMVMNRGFHTQIATEFEGLLKDSSCTFCGQCVQTCPTGALGDKKALRSAELPERDREDAFGLSVLRGGLLGRSADQGGDARRHPPGHGRPGQQRGAVRQGAVRLRFRPARRPPRAPDGPRRGRRAARGFLGRGPGARRPGGSAAPSTSTASTAFTASPPGAPPRKRPTPCRSSSARGSAPTR